MPVNRDSEGNRYVQAEVEVPGTPEEVWAAIATGKGISSWFVPTEVEEKVGGEIKASFGPGMDSLSTVRVWNPPQKLVADSRDDMGPNDPKVATEWIVETRDGGNCLVRVVHRWFTESDQWDNQFEGHTHGWVAFFRILRLYLAHFKNQPSAAFQVMGFSMQPVPDAWAALLGRLGIHALEEGQTTTATGAGAPTLAGIVERLGSADHPEILLRSSLPATGLVHMFAMPMGGQVLLSVRVFLYGTHAAETVAREELKWQIWMSEHFPMQDAGAMNC